MAEPQGQKKPRIELSLGSTKQVGELDFAKCFVSMSRDLAPGEDPAAALSQVEKVLSDFLFKHLGAAKTPPAAKIQPAAPLRPTLDPALASEIERLPWAPGRKPGREWILIDQHEEKITPLLFELEKLDSGSYLRLGDWQYRIEGEGDFIGRYPVRKGAPAKP